MLRRFTVLASLLIIISGTPDVSTGAEPATSSRRLTDSERAKITNVAKKKATELGIRVETSHFYLTETNHLIRADFWPKTKPGEIVYGGTLTIFLNRKGKILRTELSP